MKIAVLSLSTRSNSRSSKVAEYLIKQLEQLGAETFLLDISKRPLPVYDDSTDGKFPEGFDDLTSELAGSDGFVAISPEWDGMAGVGWYNLLHYTTADKPFAHKPMMLVSVSSGMGGSYPLAQMKAFGQKNNQFVVVPDNLRFANVKEALVDGQVTVDGLRERTNYSLMMLLEYAKALQSVRRSGKVDLDAFANGV